jgi:hypothetical protein
MIHEALESGGRITQAKGHRQEIIPTGKIGHDTNARKK